MDKAVSVEECKAKGRVAMKGISPIIATAAMVVLVFVLASLVGPWMLDLARTVTTTTENETTKEMECNYAGYDFDTDYATNGVNWSSALKTIYAQIKNTGTQNLYDFSFEVKMNGTSIRNFDPTTSTDKTESDPLRPGRTALLNASITINLANTTINSVKIVNSICPSTAPDAVEL